ncbi:hypothetical protein J6590_042613 [Homalodisca vitripennis]|nr:hypothetical protein J6590_042613 [Homalodisca vitripennis]
MFKLTPDRYTPTSLCLFEISTHPLRLDRKTITRETTLFYHYNKIVSDNPGSLRTQAATLLRVNPRLVYRQRSVFRGSWRRLVTTCRTAASCGF